MKNTKKGYLTSVFIILLVLLFAVPYSFADDAEARAIMEKVDARDDGDNQISDMEMILIDKKGKERIRKIHTFSKDKGEDTVLSTSGGC